MPRGSSPAPRARAQAPRHAGSGPAVLQKPSRPQPFCSLSASDDGTLQEQQPRGRQASRCNATLRTTTSQASGGFFHLEKHRAAEQTHCHHDCYLESAEKQAAGSQDNKTDARDMIQPRCNPCTEGMTEYQDLLYKSLMLSLGRTNVQLCRACSSSIPALQVFKTRNTQVQCHRAQSRAGKQTRPVARHPLSALPGPLQAPGAPSPPRSDPAGCSQCTTGEIQGISSW